MAVQLQPSPNLSLLHGRPVIEYSRTDGAATSLVLADPRESLKLQVQLPEGAVLPTPPESAVSPHGRYVVFFLGMEPSRDCSDPASTSADASLKVLDLTSMAIVYEHELLSPQYPSDRQPIADLIAKDDWFYGFTPEEVFRETQGALLCGIRTVSWSPDGSILAFASQMPGPSSDMYFWNPTSKATWRVSSELGHVQALNWSPNSSAILLTTALYYRHGTEETTYLYSANRELRSANGKGYFLGWANPNWILKSWQADYGDGYSDLVAYSASGESPLTLWPDTFADFSVAPDLSSVLFARTDTPPDEAAPRGLLRAILGSATPTLLSPALDWDVQYWGSDTFQYAASSGEGTFGIKPPTTLIPIDPLAWKMAPSPDRKQLALYGFGQTGFFHDKPGATGLRIIDAEGKPVAEVVSNAVDCLRWQPDALGIAYQSGEALYYWDAANNSTVLIDNVGQSWCEFVWINP